MLESLSEAPKHLYFTHRGFAPGPCWCSLSGASHDLGRSAANSGAVRHGNLGDYDIGYQEDLVFLKVRHRRAIVILTSRSSRPTDVLWVVAKGVALPRPFGWSEKFETYFKIKFR